MELFSFVFLLSQYRGSALGSERALRPKIREQLLKREAKSDHFDHSLKYRDQSDPNTTSFKLK